MSEFYLERDAESGLFKGTVWLNRLAAIQQLKGLVEALKRDGIRVGETEK